MSSSSSKPTKLWRRNTVYDLSSLRLHPDGLRVHQSDKNLEYNKDKRHTQYSRQQWIADNAGGSYDIPKYTYRNHPSSSEGGDVEQGLEQGQQDEDEDEEDAGEAELGKGKRKAKRPSVRPIKRKRFMENDDYLSLTGEDSHSRLPGMPSQDLLKNVHTLAAKYYDEQGLLLDASKRYRRQKRLRKLRKLGHLHDTSPDETRGSQELPEDMTVSDSEQLVAGSDEQQRRVTRDMYRVLHGSMLLAIGVLTQELVKKLVGPKMLGKEMRALPYFDDEVGSVDGDEDLMEDHDDDEDAELSMLDWTSDGKAMDEDGDYENEDKDYEGEDGDYESEGEDSESEDKGEDKRS